MLQSWIKDFQSNITNNISHVGVAPPNIYLDQFNSFLSSLNNKNILLGAQDVGEAEGPRTGEVSSSMLKDFDCSFSIIGHSERRALNFETDQIIKKKLKCLLEKNITPVLCIGESFEQMQSGRTLEALEAQINNVLKGMHILHDVVIAYEPLWAIGSGKTPNPNDVNHINEYIKDVVQSSTANDFLPKVLYGGSLNAQNASTFFNKKNIDGALVGGASLDGNIFAKIVNEFNRII